MNYARQKEKKKESNIEENCTEMNQNVHRFIFGWSLSLDHIIICRTHSKITKAYQREKGPICITSFLSQIVITRNGIFGSLSISMKKWKSHQMRGIKKCWVLFWKCSSIKSLYCWNNIKSFYPLIQNLFNTEHTIKVYKKCKKTIFRAVTPLYSPVWSAEPAEFCILDMK